VVRAGPGRVVYQLRVSAFTEEGTMRAAVERLPYLVDLGIEMVDVVLDDGFRDQRGGLDELVAGCLGQGLGVLFDGTGTAGHEPFVTLDETLPRIVGLAEEHDDGAQARETERDPGRRRRLTATLQLAGPFTPIVRMGEEWAADPAVRVGDPVVARADHGGGVRAPRGERPHLNWRQRDEPEHRDMLDLYRRLIAVRRTEPDLASPETPHQIRYWDGAVLITRGSCVVVANLTGRRQRVSMPPWPRTILFASEDGLTVNADAVELPGESAAVVGYRDPLLPARRLVQQPAAYGRDGGQVAGTGPGREVERVDRRELG
jgi:hypothetical protein